MKINNEVIGDFIYNHFYANKKEAKLKKKKCNFDFEMTLLIIRETLRKLFRCLT